MCALSSEELDDAFPFSLHGDEGTGLHSIPTLVLAWVPLLGEPEKQNASRYLITIMSSQRFVQRPVVCRRLCSKIAC